eukprot:GHUV01018931.1.p1 GENE.GHUV01018931.1~~GHUV01018931.1.p1  ORF type:complete len:475 (+),score=169.25 GHUV01018931.1:778-2202(+)
MPDHVAVVANLALTSDADKAKDSLATCCWICCKGLTKHPYGDALLAVGGSDPYIHIISVAEAAVVAQLPVLSSSAGFTSSSNSSNSSCVVDISAAAEYPGLLLVLTKDGTMQLWQVATGQSIWTVKSDAFTAVLHPQGHCIITSNRSGKLSRWNIQQLLPAPEAAQQACQGTATAAAAGAQADVVKEPLLLSGGPGGSVVDCMRFLSGDRLATKTADGRMAVHAMPHGQLISTWRVPGCSSATASYSSRCSFGHTQDGQFIAVGNHNATAYVFETATGVQVAKVEAIRVQGSVRACGLSEDCRHLLMVVGSGYIFRFESRLTAESDSDEGVDEDGADITMRDGSTPPPQAEESPGLQDQPQQPQQPQQDQLQIQQDTKLECEKQQLQQPQLMGSHVLREHSMDVQQAMVHADTHTQGDMEAMDDMLCPGPSDLTPGSQQGLRGDSGVHKKPRLDGGASAVDASPLVFKPTPQKQ